MDNNDQIVSIIKASVSGENSRREYPEVRILYHLMNAAREIQNIHGDVEGSSEEYVLKRIQDRMELGRSRYGHGVRISDDTRQWGTMRDSWAEMCEEEIIDGLIYISANLLRKKN